MGKRGPKPSSPNGEPKKRVSMALASDVLTWMRSHKPMVPWLESMMRDAMRAKESRDFGSALPSGENRITPDSSVSLHHEAVTKMREAYWSGTDELLRKWITPRHQGHAVTHILDSGLPDVDRFRCDECRETLTLNSDTRMNGTILNLTITPSVSFE